jgi:hypothetical protein
MMAMTQHYIWVLSYQQKWVVVLIAVLPQHCDVLRVSMQKASTRSPTNLAQRPLPKNNILKQNHLQPGNCLLADHYFSPIPGRLSHTFGRERNGYTCGSLFVDDASGKIFNFPHYSNTALETIKSSLQVERMAQKEGFWIKGYHSDNGIFASPEFKTHCAQHNQKYSFSGDGAKHQSGVAERNIKTVAQ